MAQIIRDHRQELSRRSQQYDVNTAQMLDRLGRPVTMPTPTAPVKRYGCFDRAPLLTVMAKDCQYTLSALGRADKKCWDDGDPCKHRAPP